MRKSLLLGFLGLYSLYGQAQFSGSVGQSGCNAFYKDSSAFLSWATQSWVNRGYADISNPSLGKVTFGQESFALGKADNQVVSLGDGGSITLTFNYPIVDEPGYDFAVFENAFNDTFLELAFVEVSSDGVNFVRFPAVSNTPTDTQIDGFGSIDATKINNLAGKHRVFYGTPFDLSDLPNTSSLDKNTITHIRIIDVVGCIQPTYAQYDANNNIVNDPWSTPFAAGGFDLDAVGVIHQNTNSIELNSVLTSVQVFPNPFQSQISFFTPQPYTFSLLDGIGKCYYQGESLGLTPLNTESLPKGIYLLSLMPKNTSMLPQTIRIVKE